MNKTLSLLAMALVILFSGCNEKGIVVVETEFGVMKIRLYDETPKHKENFIKLIKEGFYEDLLFHRVINNFMIQGGDPDSKNAAADKALGNGGPGYTLPAEFNASLFHKKGALAAARLGDQQNPEKASSGSQFYIVQGQVYDEQKLEAQEKRINEMKKRSFGMQLLQSPEYKPLIDKFQVFQKNQQMDSIQALNMKLSQIVDNAYAAEGGEQYKFTEEQVKIYSTIGGTPHLDGAYTVFGEVIEGLEVIDKIAAVATNPGDRPKEDVKMKIRIE